MNEDSFWYVYTRKPISLKLDTFKTIKKGCLSENVLFTYKKE